MKVYQKANMSIVDISDNSVKLQYHNIIISWLFGFFFLLNNDCTLMVAPKIKGCRSPEYEPATANDSFEP